jgi:hypothetical protein
MSGESSRAGDATTSRTLGFSKSKICCDDFIWVI